MIKTCSKCGGYIKSLTSGGICENCGHKLSTSDFIQHTSKTTLEPNKENSPSGLYGWICPKCGAVMSPFERCCIKCTQNGFEITFATAEVSSLPNHSHSNGSTFHDFLWNRKDKVGYE